MNLLRPGSILILTGSALAAQAGLTHGPWVGHVADDTASIWARAATAGTYLLELRRDAKVVATAAAKAAPAHDFCMTWRVAGLSAATVYDYRIGVDDQALASGRFCTAPEPDRAGIVRLAFGSCADEGPGTARTWDAVAAREPHAVILLGDTPYIDSTDLFVQRRRYREFAAVPEFAKICAHTPTYSTWDDHDFGGNDTDGRLADKDASRTAFCEYRPNGSFGDGERGIYTSFRRGPVEVFLLDTRWFAATEPSPFEQHAASLLGKLQWDWLLQGLRASTATYKVLACGMIWNGATRPGKRDHWGSYPHERDALFRAIKKHAIDGVVLIGGDIHRSRVLHHDFGGVRAFELITSPMHARIIEAANQPHSALIADFGRPHTFLLLDADTVTDPADPALIARFVDATGATYFEQVID